MVNLKQKKIKLQKNENLQKFVIKIKNFENQSQVIIFIYFFPKNYISNY